MKKFFAGFCTLSLIFAGALSLSGCGESDGSAQVEKISIFQFKVEAKDAFQKIVDEFQKENSNVEIDLQTVGGGADYGAALKTKMKSGEEPTIFNIGGPSDMDTWKSKLADLSDTTASKDAFDWSLDGVKDGDKIYGLPYSIETTGIIYNQEILTKAGIDPATLTSLDSFEKALETLASKKDDLGIKAPMAFAAKETWQTGLQMANMYLAPEFDNSIIKAFDAKTVDFKYSAEFKKFIDLNNKYGIQPANQMDMSSQMEENFANGKVAFCWGGNWAYNTIDGANPEISSKIGIMGTPVNDETAGKQSVGIPMYWTVNSTASAEQQKAAKDFLDFMYTSDFGKNTILEDAKFMPAYKGWDTDKISDPLSKQVYQAVQEDKTTGWVFMGYPDGWGMNELGSYIQSYIQKDPTDDNWKSIVIDPAKQKWADARSGK